MVPGAPVVTAPVREPIVATEVLLLDQVPPKVVLVKVVALPWHNTKVPPIADGNALIVTGVVTKQPAGNV